MEVGEKKASPTVHDTVMWSSEVMCAPNMICCCLYRGACQRYLASRMAKVAKVAKVTVLQVATSYHSLGYITLITRFVFVSLVTHMVMACRRSLGNGDIHRH